MRIALLVAAALALPAIAADARTVSAGDRSYDLAYRRDAAGVIRVDGRDLASGTPVRLSVRGRDVTGTMGAEPVAFRISDETRAAADREVDGAVLTAAR